MPTPRDRPTIGFGTTKYPDGRAVTLNDAPCTMAQAMGWLEHEVAKSDRALTALCRVPLNNHQRAAVLSLIYNIGEGAFSRSTLLRKLNQSDYVGAADQFLVWDKQKGIPLPGLATRRRSERNLFLHGDS
jgi:lysozyme